MVSPPGIWIKKRRSRYIFFSLFTLISSLAVSSEISYIPYPQGVFYMDEQWNKALDQVEDEFLLEAVRFRRRRYWPGAVAAAAAVLVLAVGWSVFRPQTQMPPLDGSTEGTLQTEALDLIPPGDSPSNGFGDTFLGGGDGSQEDVTCGAEEETPVSKTLHYASYEELQAACLDRQEWFLHPDVMVPCLETEDITVFEAELHNEPWAWYFLSHTPHLTVRIPTMTSLTAGISPDASGSEALRQLFPDAPNLHNREEFTDSYTEIREVQITTADGEKTALLCKEADRDRSYLTFLQNGTLVTIAGPEDELDGDWLEAFSLVPIDRLSERSIL